MLFDRAGNRIDIDFVFPCSLYETIDSLESRCEDLQQLVDEIGHSKKDDGAVGEDGAGGGRAVDDQDDYTKLVTQLEHAKNQRAKEQRKVSELEQNVSLLIQVSYNNRSSGRFYTVRVIRSRGRQSRGKFFRHVKKLSPLRRGRRTCRTR